MDFLLPEAKSTLSGTLALSLYQPNTYPLEEPTKGVPGNFERQSCPGSKSAVLRYFMGHRIHFDNEASPFAQFESWLQAALYLARANMESCCLSVKVFLQTQRGFSSWNSQAEACSGFLLHPQSIWQPYLAFPKTLDSNRLPVREKIKIEDGRLQLDGKNKMNERFSDPVQSKRQHRVCTYKCIQLLCIWYTRECTHGGLMHGGPRLMSCLSWLCPIFNWLSRVSHWTQSYWF